MRVRAVDSTGDTLFGGDQRSILTNSADAVGQIVTSRLNLWQGQWYLDQFDGLPVEQKILGKRTEGLRDAAIQARILDTPGVTQIEAYDSSLNRQTRGFTVAFTIQTVYSASALAGPGAGPNSITVKVENGR